MEKETFLVVGLGNPGLKYAHTRHNMGFDAIQILADRLGMGFTKERCGGLVGETDVDGVRLALCQPQTFMNLSGECVSPLLHWYKCPLDHLMVLCDDIDLAPGKLRFRRAGRAGTHNGLRNIVEQLGSTDFPRCRIGVGAPPEDWDLVNWVLGKPLTREEQAVILDAQTRAADGVQLWIKEGIDKTMSKYNG